MKSSSSSPQDQASWLLLALAAVLLCIGIALTSSGCIVERDNQEGPTAGSTTSTGTLPPAPTSDTTACPLCDDGNPCTLDTCGPDPDAGPSCLYTPLDGFACGTGSWETCSLGTCANEVPCSSATECGPLPTALTLECAAWECVIGRCRLALAKWNEACGTMPGAGCELGRCAFPTY